MTQPEFLSVKDYARHQHYRDRSPIWIKLYNAVMDDAEFIALTDAERGQLMLIWLLASRRANKIPNDASAVKRAIQASGRVNLEHFIAIGFLVPYQSASSAASNPLAESAESRSTATLNGASNVLAETEQGASTHARPRARGEGEKRREEGEKKEPSPRAAGRKGDATWITPYGAVWKEKFGGDMPIGPAVTALAPLRTEYGHTEVLRRWRNYIAVATAEHVNAARFASTWNRWNHAEAAHVNGTGDAEADAAWMAVLALLPAWQRREIDAARHAELPAATRRGLSAIGGFSRIQNTAADQRTWLRKEFVTAYRGAPIAEHANA